MRGVVATTPAGLDSGPAQIASGKPDLVTRSGPGRGNCDDQHVVP